MIIPNNFGKSNENEDYSSLFSYLITKLPPKIRGWNKKAFKEERFLLDTSLMLHKRKWIEYNQNWVNMLVIDIDNQNLEQSIERALKLDLEPTFACATDKGCHIFYVLENKVNYEWKKTIKWVEDIKEALTYAFNADKNGSHRLKGIWRNPLQHAFYFNHNHEFSLRDFDEILKKYNQKNYKPQQKFKTYVKKTRIINKNFNFEDGNRNNWLWYEGMAETRNKSYSIEQIENYLKYIQAFQGVESLDSEEISKIASSIKKYNDNGTNNITKSSNRKPRNEGIMELEPIANLSTKDFKKEVKKRQKMGAKYTNKIISKEKRMTREQQALLNSKTKENKNREIISNYLTGLYADNYKKKNGKWNIVKIAEALKMSRITITKHLKEMGEI